MQHTREDIDIATRGELENMMVLDGLPATSLTFIFGFRDDYAYILKLILRVLNCLKLVAQKKDITLDIRAFVELPKNYIEEELFKRWHNFKKTRIGFTKDFEIDELRNFYPQMVECKNFCIENIIHRGESIDFVKEWKGILAKCASQNPTSSNPFKLCTAEDAFSLSIKPFQVLRNARLIKIEDLTSFNNTKANGRLEMSEYIYINSIDNLSKFIEGAFTKYKSV